MFETEEWSSDIQGNQRAILWIFPGLSKCFVVAGTITEVVLKKFKSPDIDRIEISTKYVTTNLLQAVNLPDCVAYFDRSFTLSVSFYRDYNVSQCNLYC